MNETDGLGSDAFEQCIALNDGQEGASTKELLRCVVTKFSADDANAIDFGRSILLVYSAALVFYMQAGFAMLCAGSVQKKNVQNTMLKNLLDACGAALGFYIFGYAFAFGGEDPSSPNKTFIGSTNFCLMEVEDLAFWLYQYAFSAASVTIVAGTLAERCQMAAYLCYSVLLSGFVYPVIAHSIWSANGFLSSFSVDPLWGVGMVDFAGSGVVHVTGGVTALFATMILGPRRGRFRDETGRKLDTPKEFPGHSCALQMLGTFTLWLGWYGFNAGSALLLVGNAQMPQILALAAVNTTLAAGVGAIVSLFFNLFLLERSTGEQYFDVRYAMNGALCGLVAITAGCGVMEPWAAIITGAIAGLLYIFGSWALIKLCLDDAVDAIPVHMLNGIWGLIAVGLFSSPRKLEAIYGHSNHPGLVYTGDGMLLAIQVVGILFIFGWVMVMMLPFFVWLDWKGWFRSDPLEEIVGLDLSYHGGFVLPGSGDGDVKPEFITALKRRREERRVSNGFAAIEEEKQHSHLDTPDFHSTEENSEMDRSEF